MEPLSKYYFQDGVFKLRSSWPKRVRIILSLLFLGFSSIFAANKAHTYQTFNDIKQARVEAVASIPGIEAKDARQIISSIYKWSREFDVDDKLIFAIAKVESSFNKYAISSSGAYGIMQVIPVWHKDKILVARAKLGNPELFNINTNIFVGTWVLRDCLVKYQGNITSALQCYSGQTPGYSDKVLAAYKGLKF